LVAKKVGLKVMPFTIMWGLHGKKAGPMCNERMFREGKPQLVLVFHDDLYHDNGTKHLVAIAREADIPVRIITGKEG
jgi:hypothetical protein